MLKCLLAMWETWVRSLGREDPVEKEWQPTPVLLPGKFHELRSLISYSPWGRKESDMTERLHFHFSLSGFSSVLFSCSVVSDSLRSHGLQHTRLPCPSPSKLMPTELVIPSNHLILCCQRLLIFLPAILIPACASSSPAFCIMNSA